MSSIIKGLTQEDPIIKKEPEVHVPGYGTMPLDMLKRHVQALSKDFYILIQQGAFIKAAYKSEQFFNALLALAKALPKPDKVDETQSTGTSVGSAGIGGGAGLGIEKSPIEKVLEKPLGEGEVVSMQARQYPIVYAGQPFNWEFKDLRTGKIVASVIGGEGKPEQYELRVDRTGLREKVSPMYIATGEPNGNGPHAVYELQYPEKSTEIEKSPGPGGTTKLRPDAMDIVKHLGQGQGQSHGKYYGFDMVGPIAKVDLYTFLEQQLGGKIMDLDDAIELGYVDEDPYDNSAYIFTDNVKEEQAPMFTPEQELDEDAVINDLYKEFVRGKYNKDEGSYIETLRNVIQFLHSKGLTDDQVKPIIRKLIAKLHPSGINEEELALVELKCWSGYKRVPGTKAGEKGSCMKTESDISGLMHAAKHLDNSFIITAIVDGVTKKFRVNAQSANVAKEKFMKHYSMAKILDVKQKNSESSIMKGIQSEGK